MIYNVNDNDKRIYFVTKGEFINNIPFDITNATKYPISFFRWEILVTTRRMIKGNELFKAGSVFGQLEVADDLPRLTQVKALNTSKLYSIDWGTYTNCIIINM